MIRDATPVDISAIVRMTFDLAHATRQPLPLEPDMVWRFAASCIGRPREALALVVDRGAGPVGMIVATVASSPLSRVRLGAEHGWWCGPDARGAGPHLLARYEAWARGLGLYAIRMSTPPTVADVAATARVLQLRGFEPVEQAWTKVLT